VEPHYTHETTRVLSVVFNDHPGIKDTYANLQTHEVNTNEIV